jgi:hypothetical protein
MISMISEQKKLEIISLEGIWFLRTNHSGWLNLRRIAQSGKTQISIRNSVNEGIRKAFIWMLGSNMTRIKWRKKRRKRRRKREVKEVEVEMEVRVMRRTRMGKKRMENHRHKTKR